MNYQTITTDDLVNGEGFRTVLWVSGCEHKCKGCHNKQTHDPLSGKEFTKETLKDLLHKLDKPHIDGLTLSGGDPLHKNNIETVYTICEAVKKQLPDKTIWLYTGYTYETIKDNSILEFVDVLVDGKFAEKLADKKYKWTGSTNQRVIKLK